MESLKNICIAYPNKSNYSETFIHNQINLLNPEFEYFGSWYPYIDKSGKSFLPFPLTSFNVRGIIKNISLKYFQNTYTNYLYKEIKNNNIKAILAQYGITGCAVMNACAKSGIPLIVHFHGFDASEYETLKEYKSRYKELFEKAHSIVVVSEVMKEQIISLGADSRKVIKIPYGVDLSLFSGTNPANNDPTFVAVGRFTEKKAPQLTLKAFQLVLKTIKNARLIMIGDGELFEECKKLALDLNINSSVEFKGVLNHNDIKDNLKMARAFVQHSVKAQNGDMEGTPNTILEAAAMGLPVISTFHAGIPEAVINKKTGFLVDEGNFEEMSKYMIKLGEDNNLASVLGKEGRSHIEKNYSLNNQIKKLKDTLLTAIKK